MYIKNQFYRILAIKIKMEVIEELKEKYIMTKEEYNNEMYKLYKASQKVIF